VFIGDHFEVDHLRVKPNAVSTAAFDIVADPDLTPFSSSVRVGGHPTGTAHCPKNPCHMPTFR